MALMGLAIALLVGGAAWIGAQPSTGGSDLAAMYEAQDAQGLAEALVLETAPPGQDVMSVTAAFERLFASGSAVAEERTVSVQGTQLTEIVTTDQPPVRLCGTPDGRILIGCVVGQAPASVEQTSGDIEIGFAGVQLLPEGAMFQIVVVPTTDQPVTLSRPFELRDESGSAFSAEAEVRSLTPSGPSPEQIGDAVTVEPGGAVLVTFIIDQDEWERLLGSTVSLEFPEGGATLVLEEGERHLD